MYSNLNYIPRGKDMRQSAKKSLKYISNRPGKDKEYLERTLFGPGGSFTPEQVSQMIDEAPDNTLFWRFKFNPDPVLENPEKFLDLRQLTREAISWLEERLGTDGVPRDLPFVAAIHDDHTDLAHIHGIFFMQRQGRERPITPEIIDEFRKFAAGRALQQAQERLVGAEIAGDLSLQQGIVLQQQEEIVPQSSSASIDATLSLTDAGGEVSLDLAPQSLSCPSCYAGTLQQRLNSRVLECRECGYAERKGQVIRRGRGKEREYARSF